MEIKDKLDLDQNGTPVDATKYHSMIGALMYLMSSRLDIIHATCLCARYKSKPTKKHFKEVKRIFRYLWGTVNTGLWYSKDSGFELIDFQMLIMRDVKTPSRVLLTQLMDYGFHFNKIPIYCDSKSAIAISCNPVQHSRTRHITVRYHFIKEHVEKGTIELYFVKTDYQLADLFTEALPADCFNYLVRRLGMRSLSPHELDRLAKSHQSRRDQPMNTTADRVEVLGMIEKRSNVRIKDQTMALQPHSSGFKIQDLMLNYQRYIQDESSTLELMLPRNLKKDTKCFNAAGEELSDVKHKLMLLDTATEGRVNTAK
nr:hypothetical protein [Tanacetum cinerariifolium]